LLIDKLPFDNQDASQDMDQAANEGSRRLNECTPERGDQKKLALEMAAGDEPRAASLESQISRWGSGKAKPKTAERMWLQEHRAIPWQSWDQPAKTSSDSGEHPAVAATGTEGEHR
jgi:hypothetical protein